MIVGGTVKFKALAVLRLTTSSNLDAHSTGTSAGFAPIKRDARLRKARAGSTFAFCTPESTGTLDVDQWPGSRGR